MEDVAPVKQLNSQQEHCTLPGMWKNCVPDTIGNLWENDLSGTTGYTISRPYFLG